jgi:lactate dehydrogenase-like 2-hydroxyacid dehydrogenase
MAHDFDTGRDLRHYPTAKLEGKKFAVLGYGNIGREVAKLAQAFGMVVAVHARAKHQAWIESEGFLYAATPEAAATGADVLSPHLGLGPRDAATGRFANQDLVNASVLAALNPGAIVINYDRGECVDTIALDAAMAQGLVHYAAIDADLVKDETTGKLSGPMVPYLALAAKYPGRLELLPHAAADTDHPSRVAGAIQAIDQIYAAINYRHVINGKGDVPPGYVGLGPATLSSIGSVNAADLHRASTNSEIRAAAAASATTIAKFWDAVSASSDPRATIAAHGESLIMANNIYISLMRKTGLTGPYS